MHERLKEHRERAAGRPVEKADQAEVVKADPAIGHDEQVARMRVAVEKSHGKELVEVKIDQDLGQARPLAPHLRIVDDTALAQFLYEGALAVEVVDNPRYVDCVQPAEGFDKAADVASLLPEVGLLPQVGPELLDEIDRPELLEPRR